MAFAFTAPMPFNDVSVASSAVLRFTGPVDYRRAFPGAIPAAPGGVPALSWAIPTPPLSQSSYADDEDYPPHTTPHAFLLCRRDTKEEGTTSPTVPCSHETDTSPGA